MAIMWHRARVSIGLRGLLAVLICWLSIAPLPAAARSAQTTFVEAVRQTKVGANDVQAARAQVLLRDLRLKRERDALLLELVYRYADRLNGVPAEPELTLGALMDAGALRPPPSDTWLAQLQQGVARSVAFEWAKAEATAPGSLDPYLRVREPLAPGVWRVPFDVPKLYVVFELLNRSAHPLPMFDFTIAVPGDPEMSRYGCKFERSRDLPAHAGVPTLGRGQGGTVVCERSVPAQEEAAALAALAAMRGSGQVPELRLAVDAKEAARQVRQGALSAYGSLGPGWGAASQQAARDASLGWRVSDQPMGVPTMVPTLAHRLKHAGQALTGLMSWTMACLVLFVLGRSLQRVGVPLPLVMVATLVLSLGAALGLASIVAGPDPTAGEGWQRGATSGFVAGLGVGTVLLGALMLHVLHRRLDADGVSWFEAVLSGWRNAFRLSGTASGGEFWGFFAHGLWLLVAAQMLLGRWSFIVSALVVVAMLTMAKRRLAAFRPAEQVAMVAVLLLYVVSAMLDW
jgi:hypothetical protein